MIIKHYSMSPWDEERWPNFHPSEKRMHCKCCGEFFYDEESFDLLQKARTIAGKPFKINSGHRCASYNKSLEKSGSAKNSQHLQIAFDISTDGHDRKELYEALKEAGFTTFGFYKTFIHTDKRPNRRWYGKGAKEIWDEALA